MEGLGATMRVLRPAPGVLAFYDGRIDGRRLCSDAPNWLDDGAYGLGACSYAIVEGAEALVYDTHMSTAHAQLIRRHLADAGVADIRVVLSHWHADHVAGNAVFADCEIVANRRTASALEANRAALETGPPPIRPLVMPNRLFERDLVLRVGSRVVECRQVDIHSHDGTVLVLPDSGVLFAGDALEDPITYVTEPDRLSQHLLDIDRMASWDVRAILPNHGAPEIIGAGGYGPGLIAATRAYVAKLAQVGAAARSDDRDLAGFAAEIFRAGDIRYFAPYEQVHRRNVDRVLAAGQPGS